jgi:hypothetical protein
MEIVKPEDIAKTLKNAGELRNKIMQVVAGQPSLEAFFAVKDVSDYIEKEYPIYHAGGMQILWASKFDKLAREATTTNVKTEMTEEELKNAEITAQADAAYERATHPEK